MLQTPRMPQTPRTTRRRLLPRLLLMAASLGVSLLLAEGAVRLVRPQEAMTIAPRGLYAPDPPRRYRLSPGYRGRIDNHVELAHEVVVNRLGMRGPEPGPEGEPGRLRVLVLGDSFAFGVGAAEDETFPARLADRLRTAGSPAEVWNAGAPGYGIPDEVGWYERWGAPLRPEVVVIVAFLANDLQDAAPGSPVRVVDGELVVRSERGGPRRWLYYHSHLFRLLKTSLLEGPLRARLGLAEPWARKQRRAELALYGERLPPALAAGAAESERAIGRLVAATEASDAKVVAVLVPSLPQVDPRRWEALHRELGAPTAVQDPRRPNELFRALFARHGIAVVDATDALAAAIARGRRVYYAQDQHLTPEGYDLLAAQVEPALRQLARGGRGL
jgi:lysophospholipase L1-like esterase